MKKVLFVCMGNICRSPMAEGIFANLVKEKGLEATFHIDSAGTGGWHSGEQPDIRAQQCMKNHGVDISGQRARKFTEEDFYEFDFILCMDESNYSHVKEMVLEVSHNNKIKKMLEFHPNLKGQDVPDPYHGGGEGFEKVYQMLLIANTNFLNTLI